MRRSCRAALLMETVVIDGAEWTTMTFDPDLHVNVNSLIDVMRGRAVPADAAQWEDTKECIADCLEQFLALRSRMAELEEALRLCNDELAKAYEHGSQYQEQAAELGARLMRMSDDGK